MSERFNANEYDENDEPLGYIEQYISPPILPESGPQFEFFQSLLQIADNHKMSAEEVYKMVCDTFFIFESRFNELGQNTPERVQNGGNIFIASEHAEDELADTSQAKGVKDLTQFLDFADSTDIFITHESESGGEFIPDADLKQTIRLRITKDEDH